MPFLFSKSRQSFFEDNSKNSEENYDMHDKLTEIFDMFGPSKNPDRMAKELCLWFERYPSQREKNGTFKGNLEIIKNSLIGQGWSMRQIHKCFSLLNNLINSEKTLDKEA